MAVKLRIKVSVELYYQYKRTYGTDKNLGRTNTNTLDPTNIEMKMRARRQSSALIADNSQASSRRQQSNRVLGWKKSQKEEIELITSDTA